MGRYGETQGAEASPGRRRGRRGRHAAGSGPGGGAPATGRSRAKPIVAALVVLALLAAVGFGGYALLSRTYFVGEQDGQVAVFNGLPQTVLGLPLFWVRETTDLDVDDLAPLQAGRVREGVTASSLTDARETIERYRETVREQEAQDAGDDADADADAGEPTADPDATAP
jgi:PPM family protein phosphatase